jgi:hypothetical protein
MVIGLPETKSRAYDRYHVTGERRTSITSPPVSIDREIYLGNQRTASQDSFWPFVRNHWDDESYPDFLRNFWKRQDWGNPFITEKGSVKSSLNRFYFEGGYSGGWYAYGEAPFLINGFKEPLALSSEAQLQDEGQIMFGLGGTAIARCRPGKPQVDLATSLGELRKDGLPSMIGTLAGRSESLRDVFRNSGSEYLNIQFGWMPLIRDIQKLCEAVVNTRTVLERYEKQLNRLLRRRYRFDTQIDTVEGLSKSNQASGNYDRVIGDYPYSTTFISTRSTVVPVIETTRTVTKSHFSGGFRFYYPEVSEALDELRNFERDANNLLGLRLDPEVLWNLQPWTWLADWFVNFGDVLGNISALTGDGLVIQYAYLMRETRIEKQITFPKGVFYRSNSVGTWVSNGIPLTVELDYTRKRRVPASPFGFGLSPESFTDSQWAILAALGMSRAPK